MSGRLKQFLVNLLVSLGIGLFIATVVVAFIYLASGVLDFLWRVFNGV